MPTLQSVMDELKSKGNEKTRIIYSRHGMPIERVYGVSVADLKVIAKTIKGQQDLAYELYGTGNLDAMYLAGMIADGSKMTRDQLNSWAELADGMQMISEYTVPWVTVENPEGANLAVDWMQSEKEHVASSGWCTYSGLLATKSDKDLNLAEIESLLGKIVKEMPGAKNRVRHTMNNFIIAVGTYVQPLVAKAKETAQKVGVVSVDMGDTACKVPSAIEYIAKAESANKTGLKKKTIRC